METQLKVGDVVKLKSGGPRMTISYLGKEEQIECIWFDGNNKSKGYFHKDSVKLDDSSSNPLRVKKG
ncbi:Uncharacterized small protein [Legionella beliardensis]|uniref:Uncharacterized small protein n=1 Tax=Legionella beliardensis TaxID=91822 RepID=A0A378I5N6_9GAMM|nr:DUF2158 domain-containing protein [Legionella beliardensis]STX29971.1 Uncharacterized small protein [Legionella beliardensis]